MAWCREASSHHRIRCWPRSLSPYDVTRPVRPLWAEIGFEFGNGLSCSLRKQCTWRFHVSHSVISNRVSREFGLYIYRCWPRSLSPYDVTRPVGPLWAEIGFAFGNGLSFSLRKQCTWRFHVSHSVISNRVSRDFGLYIYRYHLLIMWKYSQIFNNI